MQLEISLVELQLHVAAALAPHGIGAEAFELVPAPDGDWRIQLYTDGEGHAAAAADAVETSLRRRYRVHRLSRGGVYGG